MEKKNNCIIKTTLSGCSIILGANIYEVIKQDLENLGLFSHEDIVLAFLSKDLTNKESNDNNIQIQQINRLGEQEFKVKYVRNKYNKVGKSMIFFNKVTEVKEWDEIYYRVFYNTTPSIKYNKKDNKKDNKNFEDEFGE
jgi:hypothetical protein